MVLALIINIGLSALVFGVVIAMLVRGIHTPVHRTALLHDRTRPVARAATSRPRAGMRAVAAGRRP